MTQFKLYKEKHLNCNYLCEFNFEIHIKSKRVDYKRRCQDIHRVKRRKLVLLTIQMYINQSSVYRIFMLLIEHFLKDSV